MKLIRLMLIVFAIGFSTNSNALTTMGDRGCGVRVNDHTTNSVDWNTVAENTWLTGYLSGIAFWSNVDVLKSAEGESLILWVTNYCKNNPLDKLSTAASRLALELKKRMH
jgi:hypothetical protein